MRVIIRGLDKIREQPELVIKAIDRGLLGVATKTMEELVKNTPADTGRLRGGYRINRLNMGFGYRITNNNKYGLFVNYGTRPFYPPIRALKGWARRKGLNPYAVQRSIGKRGLRAQHFLEKTLKKVKYRVQDWFENYFKL